MPSNYDFSGWATRNDLKCSDGRIIRRDAFAHNDGMTVPLVWNHVHGDLERVIGHALLENREEGVYAYGKFNDTNLGQTAKVCVQHGDITALSIYANQLKQQGPNVMHGNIRELSLVLAGANPGAYIENVIKHGDDIDNEEARIFTGLDIELYHADKEENKEEKGDAKVAEVSTKKTENSEKEKKTVGDIFESLTEEQKQAVYAIIGQLVEAEEEDEKEDVKHSEEDETDEEVMHAESEKSVMAIIDTLNDKQKKALYIMIDDAVRSITGEDDEDDDDDDIEVSHADSDDGNENIGDIFKTFTDEQKEATYSVIGFAMEDAAKKVAGNDNKEVKHSEGGEEIMKTNVFDQEERFNDTLSHGEMLEIFEEAKRYGSLKEAVLAHGIEGIGELFPESKLVNDEPVMLNREQSWVTDVLNSVHHTPFTRIRSIYADITAEQARAKGYTKGKEKIEEVIKAFKRVTTATTIYKKQKLDRDDILDITEFSVVAFLKKEMRMMLNEELARAVLFGDGREEDDNDKINEENIRPIYTDNDVYTHKEIIKVNAATTAEDKAKALIKASVKSRKNYKGSGRPTAYMLEDMVAECLLLEDVNGRRIYDTIEKLAAAMSVSKIIPVPLEGVTRKKDDKTYEFGALIVNLADYNVGTDKGGEVNLFDDFDIDFNQYKYLMETRCSGALTKPKAAVAIDFLTEEAAG